MSFEGIAIWYELIRTWANANAGLLALLSIVVAILVALLLAIQGTLRQVGKLAASPILRVAHKLGSLRTRLILSRHRSRARTIMERNMGKRPCGFSIAVGVYHRSLEASPATSACVLREFISEAPAWLNDYYVTTAMEDLVAKGCLAKGTRYSQTIWPPEEVWYFFRHRDFITGSSVAAESDRIETDSMCAVYQMVLSQQCFLGGRFEREEYSETISPQEVRHRTRTRLKEGAPPCKRCWELNAQQRALSGLVVNFLENELAEAVQPLSAIKEDLQGTYYISRPGPFISTVVGYCMDTGISVDEVDVAWRLPRERLPFMPATAKNRWMRKSTRMH